MYKIRVFVLAALILVSACSKPAEESPRPSPEYSAAPSSLRLEPKNVILFIGDGMGYESVRAASLYTTGREDSLSFQSFPHKASVKHDNALGQLTDSAAAATAMATGVKVGNGVLSLALPGDASSLKTLLEIAQSQGKKTGLVTTSIVEDATVAAFAAHQPRRNFYKNIATELLTKSRPHVLMGGYRDLIPTAATEAGYNVALNREELMSVDPESTKPLAGLFTPGPLPYEFDGDYTEMPRLSEMTQVALTLLESDPDGFFLMVENENIDESGHKNNLERHIAATLELHEAVRKTMIWASERKDTLIIVTSDHETGGLTVVAPGAAGALPEATWSTTGHTSTQVPLYAAGVHSERFFGTLENTDVFKLLTTP